MACVASPPQSALEAVQRVSIISAGAGVAPDLHARGRGESALRGAGSGTMDAIGQCGNAGGSGDFAGIGVILCVGLATTVGTIGGAVLGAMKGLPRDDLRKLNAELDEYVRLHERPQDRLIEVLSDRIGAIRELTSRDPDLLLGVRLGEVRLEQHPGRELSLVVVAFVEIELPKSTANARRYERDYRFAGTRRPVADWLERRGAGVSARVDEAFAGLADEIVGDLLSESAR